MYMSVTLQAVSNKIPPFSWFYEGRMLIYCLQMDSWPLVPNPEKPIMIRSRDSSVGISTGYALDDRIIGVRFPVGAEIFLFDTVSRPALEPTQPLVQWVVGAVLLGVKRQGREADNSLPSCADVKE
jgi:hypothetical protein